MDAASSGGTFDAAKVSSVANQQAQVIAQLLITKQKLQSEIYNDVLTPEQRAKADQLRTRIDERIDGFIQHLEQ
jgi:Spy/CpxP family protein refolding chaperone